MNDRTQVLTKYNIMCKYNRLITPQLNETSKLQEEKYEEKKIKILFLQGEKIEIITINI